MPACASRNVESAKVAEPPPELPSLRTTLERQRRPSATSTRLRSDEQVTAMRIASLCSNVLSWMNASPWVLMAPECFPEWQYMSAHLVTLATLFNAM